MQAGVALVKRVDVGVIAMAHEEQVAVSQHRALGLAGRPARVKKPRPIGGTALDRPHRGAALEERPVTRALG